MNPDIYEPDDDLTDLFDEILSVHRHRPTLEQLTGVVTQPELVRGAFLGFTDKQCRIISNNTRYLADLAELWADGVPQSVRLIAHQDDDLGALHREIIDLAGADPDKSDGYDLPLTAPASSGAPDSIDDLDLEWLLFTESTQTAFRGGTPRSTTQPDQATILTYRTRRKDPLTGAHITVKPAAQPGTWVIRFVPLTSLGKAQLHLRWSDGSITTTTCTIEEDERVSLLLTPPTPDATPTGLRIRAYE